jgi:DNA-binding transcriptional ArsR family regulator
VLVAEHNRDRLDRSVIAAAAAHAKALGDATRLTVAVALRGGGELCVCDRAWIADKAKNLVGHHPRALRSAARPTRDRRGKIVFSTLTTRSRELLDAPLATTAATA